MTDDTEIDVEATDSTADDYDPLTDDPFDGKEPTPEAARAHAAEMVTDDRVQAFGIVTVYRDADGDLASTVNRHMPPEAAPHDVMNTAYAMNRGAVKIGIDVGLRDALADASGTGLGMGGGGAMSMSDLLGAMDGGP